MEMTEERVSELADKLIGITNSAHEKKKLKNSLTSEFCGSITKHLYYQSFRKKRVW